MLIWRIGSYGVPYGFRQSYLWKLWMALALEKAGVDQKKIGTFCIAAEMWFDLPEMWAFWLDFCMLDVLDSQKWVI